MIYSAVPGLTRVKLAYQAEQGLPDLTTGLDWLQKIFTEDEFLRFISITYKHPVRDRLLAEKNNKSIVNRIRRAFYGRRLISKKLIKFLFIIENFPSVAGSLDEYHVHFIMSEPKNCIPARNKYSCNTQNYHDQLITSCILGSKITGGSEIYRPVNNIDIRHVYNKDGNIEYLYKDATCLARECYVDLFNSTLPSCKDADGRLL